MSADQRRKWIAAGVAATIVVLFVGAFLTSHFLEGEAPNYSKIEEGLYLGGYVKAPPPEVQAVINLCELEDPYRVEAHRWTPIRDAEPTPTLEWLREQVQFIEDQRSASRTVFVHCRNGVSRSGMVTTAYLMRRERWTRDQALQFLRTRRPEIRPNPAFMQLLLEWERSLKS